ncbi:MAG TPA: beta-L-arabinofuranosidase domain-containing protein, partial [Solirubrobacteraceae bacterium]
AQVTLRPLDGRAVSIGDGLLGERQRLNREVTLIHGWDELERVGNFENFRIAAGRATGTRRGYVFSDSDVYKWLEAVAWEIGREPSAKLERLANEAIELVAAVQQPDGYLNTWCQIVDPSWRWSDLEMGHELYCAGHLIQAGIAFDRAAGDASLLRIARRFADLIDDEFRGGPQTGTDGHPEIEAPLVELYRHTGERRYLELSETLVERRGHGQFADGRFGLDYYQDSEPVRESRSLVGHAVRALYLAAGVTDICAETGDEQLRSAMLAQWDDMTSAKSYLTGGVGSRHSGESIGDPYELPPDRAYCETCASIASIMWNWRLLLMSGEPRFADLIERTLYNGFLSGISLDGREFFYVNPLQSRGGHARHSWNPVACCPPNIMRLLASLQQYIATQDGEGIQVHQYTQGQLSASSPDGEPIELRIDTRYPWEGNVEIEVTSTGDAEWTLSMRIPGWATDASLDGEPVAAGSYARIRRRWTAGERVVLALDVSPRLTAPNPRIDAVRGCLAIERGPLVYCVEDADLPSEVDLADLRINPGTSLGDAGSVDALDGVHGVAVAANVSSLDGWRDVEYRDLRELGAAEEVPAALPLLAVPYFAWANRGAGAMRVWIPAD